MRIFTVLLLACGTETPSTDTAGGADDTGDAGPADELPWTGSCPAASGLADGATFEYVYNADWEAANARTGGWNSEVTANDDGSYTVVQFLSASGSNVEIEQTTTLGYTCDAEGLWLVSQHLDVSTSVYEADPYVSWTEYTYDGPVFIMPVTVEEGQKWQSIYAGTWVNELDMKRSADATFTFEFTGVEALEVPAGSWNAMKWVSTSATGVEFNSWWVSGLGMVADQDSDLTAYSQ